jgi:hypothetical protein
MGSKLLPSVNTGIHGDRAAQLQVVGHPLFAGLLLGRLSHQQGAHVVTLAQAQQGIGLAAPSDHRRCTRTRCPLGRQNFGDHAPPPNTRTRSARHGFQGRVSGTGLVHKGG